jgi:hypothetical protein
MDKKWITAVEDLERPSKHVSAAMAPDGAAQASKNRKDQINYKDLVRKGGNMFVACAQQLNDPDQLHGMQMIFLFSGPEFSVFNLFQQNVQGHAGALAHFHAYATGAWLDGCKATLRTCHQVDDLERCGFLMQFTESSTLGVTSISPEVRYQDGLARTLCYGAFRLVRNRIGSNLQHSHYPLALAGLLKPSTRGACLDQFAEHVRAWWLCKDWAA